MKKICAAIAAIVMLFSLSGCGYISSLSDEEAYNLGYDIGYYGAKLLSN